MAKDALKAVAAFARKKSLNKKLRQLCFNATKYLVSSKLTCSAKFCADFIRVNDGFHSLVIE